MSIDNVVMINRIKPGGLSVSRTIGDYSSKLEKFGGKQGNIISVPEIFEIKLDNDLDFIILGSKLNLI